MLVAYVVLCLSYARQFQANVGYSCEFGCLCGARLRNKY